MFGGFWNPINDCDPRAVTLYWRHYSSKKGKRKTPKIVGPGESLLLMTTCGRALFVWWKQKFRLDGQDGICCSVFRNEGAWISSLMIGEAEDWAWRRWPNESRLFTFVDPSEVASRNPGYCFKVAGWNYVGKTSKGLHILEKLRRE